MRVLDIMRREVMVCTPDSTLASAGRHMAEADCGVLPVVDEDRHLAGILSLDDVVLEARPFEGPGFTGPVYCDIAETLKAICAQPVPAVGS